MSSEGTGPDVAPGDATSAAGEPGAIADVFDQLPLLLGGFTGPEHRFDAVNAAYRAFMNGADVLGRAGFEAFPELVAQQTQALMDRVYTTGQQESIREWRFQATTGPGGQMREFYLDMTLAPRRAADGSVTGVAMYALEVTDRVLERQAAQQRAVEAQQRYEAVRDVVVELQEALLPATLPVLPGVEVAARYLVAAEDQAAGGDWFDVLPLPDGTVALVVGDVVGHGVAASAAMGQLRAVLSTVLTQTGDVTRALSWVDQLAARASKPPTSTTTALTGAARGSTPAPMYAATVLLAVLDSATGQLRYASCGHPPPLIIDPDGSTRYLPLPGGGPVGTGDIPVIGSTRLTPGQTLLLYSDGLVEQSDRPLQEGLGVLAEVAAAAVTNRLHPLFASVSAVERVCQQAVELLTRTGYDDDVTAMAVQVRSAPVPSLTLHLTADLAAVAATRDQLRDWLDGVGATESEHEALELAATELVANAVEHAYVQFPAGLVHVHVALGDDGVVELHVDDEGTWQEPEDPAPGSSGRGLWLTGEAVDTLTLQHGRVAGDPVAVAPAHDGSGAPGTRVTVRHRLHRPALLVADGAHVQGDRAPRPSRPQFSADQVDGAGSPILVRGPVDITTSPLLGERIATISRGGVHPVTIDLSQVTVLSSAGVATLLETRDRYAVHGHPLPLVSVPDSLADQILHLVGLKSRHR